MTDDLRVLPLVVPRGAPCALDFEGSPVRAYEGESVAVALWAAGVRTLARSTKFHRPRGAFCFDGHCASCLLRIEGQPNVRACMTPARADLHCERQNSFPSAELDILVAADWMFPQHMDHHTLMTGNRLANRLLVGLVRQMGGSGTLPDVAPAITPPVRDHVVDVCIVGAGPAGLTAASEIGRRAAHARVLLIDEQSQPGGSWLAEPDGAARARAAVERARAAGVKILARTAAIGFFPEDIVATDPDIDAPRDAIVGTLAIAALDGLRRVAARRILYTTGAYDQNLAFDDNDRPGVISARACGRLAFRHGLRPGRRVAIVGADAYGDRLAAGLVAVGMPADRVVRVNPTAHRVSAARGATTLRGLELVGPDGGQRKRIDADVVAIAATPAPASELPRQHHAEVRLDEARGGFIVLTDDKFQTRDKGVYCCGDVTGYVGPSAAEQAGSAAAVAITQTLDQP